MHIRYFKTSCLLIRHLLAKCLLIAMLSVMAGPAYADQNNPALDPLFDALKHAPTQQAAAQSANEIWRIWLWHERDEIINLLMQQGITAMDFGQLQIAELVFSQIIALDPNFAEGWNKRATVRAQLGMFDHSRQDIAQVLRLERRHFGALVGLGSLELHNDDPKAALRAYKAALAIYPRMQNIIQIVKTLEKQTLGIAL